MEPTEKRKIIKKALNRFGLDHQIDKMIEELGELLQATIKLRQASKMGRITAEGIRSNYHYNSFVEELADFDVLRDQILYALDLEDKQSLFNIIKQQKFERLDNRLSQSKLDDFQL